MSTYLLDTCAVIWISNGDPLREPAAEVLQKMHAHEDRIVVSPMTAWEIGMLAAKGKIALPTDPETWFGSFCTLPGVSLAGMPPSVLIASCALPGTPPTDPVDCILAATARALGYMLVTRDQKLLAYGESGHIQALEC